jgi:pimeloyl-ACP methyl ester carboxylesterase
VADLVIESDDVELAARDYGGTGETGIVLLHGGGHNLSSFDTLGPLLADRYRVIAYDMRAHGLSTDPGQVSYAAEVADLRRVTAFMGFERPVLVGHSYGGAIAALAAANEPNRYRAVITIDQALIGTWEEVKGGPPRDEVDAIAGWEGSGGDVDALVDEVNRDWAAGMANVGSAVIRRGHREVAPDRYERMPPVAYLRSFANPDSDLPEDERRRYSLLAEIYDRMTCPLLALFTPAWQDKRGRFEGRLEARPRTEVLWFDTGHSIHWEVPDDVAAAIVAFLQRFPD